MNKATILIQKMIEENTEWLKEILALVRESNSEEWLENQIKEQFTSFIWVGDPTNPTPLDDLYTQLLKEILTTVNYKQLAKYFSAYYNS